MLGFYIIVAAVKKRNHEFKIRIHAEGQRSAAPSRWGARGASLVRFGWLFLVGFCCVNVEVVRQYQARPTLTVDKHKVLQILVNLIRNAKYACDESGRADKRLTVQVTNGAGQVKIAVTDNGIGIPEENLTRIFNHGYTTRKDGHGFELHSGALAARELGGSLTAHSGGCGLGATFTLELPLQPITTHV